MNPTPQMQHKHIAKLRASLQETHRVCLHSKYAAWMQTEINILSHEHPMFDSRQQRCKNTGGP